jgi:two-component system, NtrC family, sensor kinase
MARILVIDDSDDVRGFVRDILVRDGYEVVEVALLQEAREWLIRNVADAVVCDIDLPDGDGLSMIPFVGISKPLTRVVVITGHVSIDHAVRALHSGAYDFIPKPIVKDDLLSAVGRAVEARDLEERNEELVSQLAGRVRSVNEVLTIARDIGGSRDLHGVLERSLERAIEFLDAEAGAILLARGEAVEVAVARGGPDPDELLSQSFPRDRGIGGWVLQNKRPLVVNDTLKDPRFDERLDGAIGGYVYSVLACPLIVKNETIGVLEIVNRRSGRFTREARLEAETLSFSIAAAVENARINDKLAASQAALVEHNCSLERRVLDRTGELRAANERLAAANHRLEETRDQMVRAEKMASIGGIAAGVAHEINNPIGFINSNLQTLKGYISDLKPIVEALRVHCPPSDPLQAKIEKVDLDFVLGDIETLVRESEDGVRRVVKIVGDLKTYSRSDSGPPEDADILSCIQSALSLSRNETKYVADIVTELSPLPSVRCHPVQVTQVLVNLIVNAAHAIQGHGTIWVRSRQQGGDVVLEVSDSGSGISPENLSKIFDPFFTTKDPGKGTGLGLSLSYEIVERHGGEIKVTSRVGEGSTFSVRLPIAGAEVSANAAA